MTAEKKGASTLTNLYNARKKGEVQWLEDAHRTLDAVVARAYGESLAITSRGNL